MAYGWRAAGLAVLLLCGIAAASGDRVVLKTGQTITGEILAERKSLLYFDVGVDVLRIPRQQISSFEYAGQQEDSQDEQSQLEKSQTDIDTDANSTAFYYDGNAKAVSIEQCVERVAEAVVKVSSPAGMGSGFFFNKKGFLITNYHVIERETKITVTVFRKSGDGFERKTYKKVKIIALNPFVDLALLKVEDLGDEKVKYAPLGDMADIKVGQQVFAIGNPLGLERTVTDGVISTTNRAFEGLVYIQTNADINPGNSGGPLFNLRGEVVGVTNMGYIFYGGLGFAIPVDYVRHFIENRDAFTYDTDSPNTGYRYIQPDGRRNKNRPAFAASNEKTAAENSEKD